MPSFDVLEICRDFALGPVFYRIRIGSNTIKYFEVVDPKPKPFRYGDAFLKVFHQSYKTSDQALLEAETAAVETVLASPLQDPGGCSEELFNKLIELEERDGGVHPIVWWEAGKEERITITQADHRALLNMYWLAGERWKDTDMKHALKCREATGDRWLPLLLSNSRL